MSSMHSGGTSLVQLMIKQVKGKGVPNPCSDFQVSKIWLVMGVQLCTLVQGDGCPSGKLAGYSFYAFAKAKAHQPRGLFCLKPLVCPFENYWQGDVCCWRVKESP